MALVGRFLVGITRRKHHAFDTEFHHLVKECAHALGVGAIKKCGVSSDAETVLQRFLDALDGLVVPTFQANRKIVVLSLAIHVDGEGQVLARFKQMDFLLEQQRICAQIDVLLACDQAFDDFADLRVQQGFPARDSDCRRATLIDRAEALLRGKLHFQHVAGILNFPTARA